MKYSLTFLFLLLLSLPALYAQVKPLPKTHAHNDYEHERPLFDALSHGFTSVEADVHLIDGQLFVTHNKPVFTKNLKTLTELYLRPLDSLTRANGGAVFPGYNGPFYLMIDFKTEGEPTYAALKAVLASYPQLLSSSSPAGPVTIFISGERPVAKLLEEKGNPVALDGRPFELGQGISPNVMPVVSTSFKTLGYWNGQGTMPFDLQLKVRQLAESAHKEGKKLRLWATPDEPAVWEVLLQNGVDFVNTDDLAGLEKFLLSKQ